MNWVEDFNPWYNMFYPSALYLQKPTQFINRKHFVCCRTYVDKTRVCDNMYLTFKIFFNSSSLTTLVILSTTYNHHWLVRILNIYYLGRYIKYNILTRSIFMTYEALNHQKHVTNDCTMLIILLLLWRKQSILLFNSKMGFVLFHEPQISR